MTVEAGFDLLREMEQEGVAPDVRINSPATTACGTGGESGQAIDLFQEVERKGIAHDVVSYNTAIKVCGNGRQWKPAIDLLREIDGDERCCA